MVLCAGSWTGTILSMHGPMLGSKNVCNNYDFSKTYCVGNVTCATLPVKTLQHVMVLTHQDMVNNIIYDVIILY